MVVRDRPPRLRRRRAAARHSTPASRTLFAHYARAGAWRVFPEVPAVARRAPHARARLAVVSNFDRRLVGLLAALGLAPLVDAVVYSTRAGAAKPDPRIFRRARSPPSPSRPSAALHVGDALDADVEGARAADLHAVLVARRAVPPVVPAGVPVVRTLRELPAVVGALA